MIKTKEDFIEYLRADFKLNQSYKITFIKLYFKSAFNPQRRFLLLLRTCEYYMNCNKKGLTYRIVKYLKFRQGLKTGFSIPENVLGKGVQLPHYGTIVINKNAKIGKYCRIHVCVNIGASGGSLKAPQIGNHVYIAPGAKLYGDIQIADRIAIAANAAVGKSFLNSNKLIGGIPAKEIGDVNITKIIVPGEQIS